MDKIDYPTQTVPINTIQPNPDNPRIIKNDKFEKLIKSIKEFPEMLSARPIVVDADMIILGGNMRHKAAQAAGLTEIPIIKVDFTGDKAKEFIIKDNVGFGEWDWDILANEWDLDSLDDWGLEVQYLEPQAEVTEDFYEPGPLEQIETDIKLGDIIEIGEHRLMCGDSTNPDHWELLMNGKQADLIMTDPPYNVDYEGKTKEKIKISSDKQSDDQFYQFLLDFFTAVRAHTKPGGACYVWHADSEGRNFRLAFENAGFLMKQCLIWVKNTLVMGRQDYQWKHEPCLYGWNPGAAHYFIDDRTNTTVIEDDPLDFKKMKKEQLLDYILKAHEQPSSVIHCDRPTRSELYPTMKPILLLAPLIQNSSKKGQIVADGFLGSGSTMVAANQLNRTCYGMELDPRFCQVTVNRMKQQ